MVLQIAYAAVSAIFPTKYYVHIACASLVLLVAYAFAQGRTTNRERDLHARVVILTGAFTPLGLTLLTALATRGAHVIAISSYPLEHAYPSLIIPLLRTTTKNENIFAEHADLSNPASIREFCTRFLTGQDQRLDAIVFAHEYRGIGSIFGKSRNKAEELRETSSLATFLMLTLLLPALLVEPAERDIRIVNIINPFYAASTPLFPTTLSSGAQSPSLFLQEGARALRTAVLTRHLQRVLDSLPNREVTPDSRGTKKSSGTTSAQSPKGDEKPRALELQPSNIIAVSVCPGISRKDTIVPLLSAQQIDGTERSLVGFFIYVLLFPILWLFTKSPTASVQSVLHVIFLPTPLKRALAHIDATINPTQPPKGESSTDDKQGRPRVVYEEVVKPGALYRECAVVKVDVPPLPQAPAAAEIIEAPKSGTGEHKTKEKGKSKDKGKKLPQVTFPDDGEIGGEEVGRAVWEWYEEHLKVWEARFKAAEVKGEESEGQSGVDATS
ncbi:hypothetical protein WOLCODRAFT_107668 [Wolfiporia cocos MD-104 SS10]|uniref:Ketoreductase (KR) domain-containing protein n=1 Tax=Wolfiporia cocos (strain MD-104) TaxID=742152 RepID=A0A2H3J7B9_WOLCO|nr:hypothetical protein WOLCODRAFT_107668 [Wolfiporia cocos MD-104 SS10]